MLRALRFLDENRYMSGQAQEKEFCEKCNYARQIRTIQRSPSSVGIG